MMEIVLIRLNSTGQVDYFEQNNVDIKKDDLVIVKIEKGLEFGRVESIVLNSKIKNNIFFGKILRVANEDDLFKINKNETDAKKALKKCLELVKKEKLDMRVIDANYTFDRQQLIFRFLSDDRVDFRQLAKELGGIYKTRIELR